MAPLFADDLAGSTMQHRTASKCFWLKPTLAKAISSSTSVSHLFPDLEEAFSKKRRHKRGRKGGSRESKANATGTVAKAKTSRVTTPFVLQTLMGTVLSAQLPMLVAKLVKLHGSVGGVFRAIERCQPDAMTEEVRHHVWGCNFRRATYLVLCVVARLLRCCCRCGATMAVGLRSKLQSTNCKALSKNSTKSLRRL